MADLHFAHAYAGLYSLGVELGVAEVHVVLDRHLAGERTVEHPEAAVEVMQRIAQIKLAHQIEDG